MSAHYAHDSPGELRHFRNALQVGYNIDGWLNKNKDPINESVVSLLASSKEKLVSSLFQETEPGKVSPRHRSPTPPPWQPCFNITLASSMMFWMLTFIVFDLHRLSWRHNADVSHPLCMCTEWCTVCLLIWQHPCFDPYYAYYPYYPVVSAVPQSVAQRQHPESCSVSFVVTYILMCMCDAPFLNCFLYGDYVPYIVS